MDKKYKCYIIKDITEGINHKLFQRNERKIGKLGEESLKVYNYFTAVKGGSIKSGKEDEYYETMTTMRRIKVTTWVEYLLQQ